MEIPSNLKYNGNVVFFLTEDVEAFINDMKFIKTNKKKLKTFLNIIFKPKPKSNTFQTTGAGNIFLLKGALVLLVSLFATLSPYMNDPRYIQQGYMITENFQALMSSILSSYKKTYFFSLNNTIEESCLLINLFLGDNYMSTKKDYTEMVQVLKDVKLAASQNVYTIDKPTREQIQQTMRLIFGNKLSFHDDTEEVKFVKHYCRIGLQDKDLTLCEKILSQDGVVAPRSRLKNKLSSPIVTTLFLNAVFPDIETSIGDSFWGLIEKIKNSFNMRGLISIQKRIHDQSVLFNEAIQPGDMPYLTLTFGSTLLAMLAAKTIKAPVFQSLINAGASMSIILNLLYWMGVPTFTRQYQPDENTRIMQETDLLFVGFGLLLPDIGKLFHAFYKKLKTEKTRKRSKKKMFLHFIDTLFTSIQLALGSLCLLSLLACDAVTNKCAITHEYFAQIHMQVSSMLSFSKITVFLYELLNDPFSTRLFHTDIGSEVFNILFINYIANKGGIDDGKLLFYIFFIGLQSASKFMVIDKLPWSVKKLYKKCIQSPSIKDQNKQHASKHIKNPQLPSTNRKYHTGNKQQNQQRRNSNVND